MLSNEGMSKNIPHDRITGTNKKFVLRFEAQSTDVSKFMSGILYHFDWMFTIFGKNSPEMADKFSFELRWIKKKVCSGVMRDVNIRSKWYSSGEESALVSCCIQSPVRVYLYIDHHKPIIKLASYIQVHIAILLLLVREAGFRSLILIYFIWVLIRFLIQFQISGLSVIQAVKFSANTQYIPQEYPVSCYKPPQYYSRLLSRIIILSTTVIIRDTDLLNLDWVYAPIEGRLELSRVSPLLCLPLRFRTHWRKSWHRTLSVLTPSIL